MRLPDAQTLAALAAWAPANGVLSVYVDIDPADRAGGWHAALRERLGELSAEAKATADRERGAAIKEAADRVLERLPGDGPHPSGRTHIGFVEAGGRQARQDWYAVQLPIAETMAVYSQRPYVRPLAELLDSGRPRGVAALSADRVRIFDWRLGTMDEVDGWGLEMFSLDWREKKGPTMRDPASGQATTSAGRDQFDQRLEENRKRFIKETGRLTNEKLARDARREMLIFGDPGHAEIYLSGWDRPPAFHTVDHHDVIAEPTHAIAERVTERIAELDRKRADELVNHTVESALARNGSGALGPSPTARALIRGQVERLLIDPTRELDAGGLDADVIRELEAASPRPGSKLDEWMIEQAVATGASIVPVREEAAERLAEYGGVAGLLRY